MFIDDKLRKILVGSAEKLGISSSILLDWARAKSDEDWFIRTAVELLRNGTIEVVGISNQRPVFYLTKQGEMEAESLRQENSCANRSKELDARRRGH
jgi:hypothetical protein